MIPVCITTTKSGRTDGRWIYVVRGRPATREMDLWRIPSSGGTPEKLTYLKADVAFPVPLDDRTLVFVAHSPQGAGPWLWVFDLKMRRAQRFSTGFEQYTAVAASADGERLAAAVVNAQSKLWSVPIADQTVGEQAVETVQIPVARAQAPRFGGDSLFYLSSRDGPMECGDIAIGRRMRSGKDLKAPSSGRRQFRRMEIGSPSHLDLTGSGDCT